MYNSICRYGAVEARWPHKPKDGGSKPSTGKLFIINLINYLNILIKFLNNINTNKIKLRNKIEKTFKYNLLVNN